MSDIKNNKIINIIKEIFPYIFIILLVLFIKSYIITPIKVNGESMMKTLHDGDIMILNIIDYKINGLNRFDIVVVDEGDEYIIKRVIGLPGEEVEYKDNKLYINKVEVEDKYAYGDTTDFDIVLGKDSYFVLGDNRENSLDSRYFGAFNKKKILGKTSLVLFPFNRFGNK
jgi:signal peptidase I